MTSPNDFQGLLEKLGRYAQEKDPGNIRKTWDSIQNLLGLFVVDKDGAIIFDSSSDEDESPPPPPKRARVVIFGPEKDYMRELYVQCVRVKILLAKGRSDGDEKFYVENILRKAVVDALFAASGAVNALK